VLDDGVTEQGEAFLVMELLQGETLEARLQRGRASISLLELLRITDELLDVLAAAHAQGIVHRDVKPENVFLSREGTVRLLDFGIARALDTRRTLRTQIGSTMGTPAFMAPEQARGRWQELDGRTDLWSVGATMYVALTGRLLRDAETPNEELLQAMTRPAPAMATVLPALPRSVAEVIDRALAFKQAERWESAREMQAAVRHALLDIAGGASSFPPNALESSGVFASAPATYRPVSSTLGTRTGISPRVRSGLTLGAAGAGVLLLAVLLWTKQKAMTPAESRSPVVTAAQRSAPTPLALPSVPALPAPLPEPGELIPEPEPPAAPVPPASATSAALGKAIAPAMKAVRALGQGNRAPPPAPTAVSAPGPAPAASTSAAPPADDPLSRRK
jgi:serine/threonine-protein kinase